MMKIFIVDDDPVARMVLATWINKSGHAHQVLAFENGKELLDYIDGEAQGEKEDVIVFLDINMPVMNGWDFLEQMKSRKNYKLKVIIITSSTDRRDKVKANSSDLVVDYIEKPVKEKDWLHIQKILL